MGAPDPHRMTQRLSVVGCGTAAPDGERVCSGYWMSDGGTHVLFDCGPGIVHHLARFGLPWQRLTHLALSHFHNDHTGDVPMLLFALQYGLRPARTAPLVVLGPPGTSARFAAMAAAFGEHVDAPPFPLEIREIGDDDIVRAGSVEMRAAFTPHTDASLAYRARGSDFTLGFTGDTGPSSAVGEFLHGVDELIAECSLPDEEATPIHLSPASLARLAMQARPARLIVTHVYPQLDRRSVPALLNAHGWDGACIVAADGMVLR